MSSSFFLAGVVGAGLLTALWFHRSKPAAPLPSYTTTMCIPDLLSNPVASIPFHLKQLVINEAVREQLRTASPKTYVKLMFLELCYSRILWRVHRSLETLQHVPNFHDSFQQMVKTSLHVIQGMHTDDHDICVACTNLMYFYKLYLVSVKPSNWVASLNVLSKLQMKLRTAPLCCTIEKLYHAL